ncbi:MAG: PD-(D/E)XK motif protein [Gammaproteobacteria bacterium]|nr:PD-(D/E)XK motif protein [Gammaproteobacteria bacterium]
MPDSPTATAAGNWAVLRSGARQDDADLGGALEIPTIPTSVSTPAGQVRLAIGQNGEARVLLPLAPGETPAQPGGGAGLSVSISSYQKEGEYLRFLDLVCLSKDLETVFGEVVDEILVRVAGGETCAEAATSTVADFRLLLERAAAGDVDRRTVGGLIGELLVLNRLLERSSSAWEAWRGPASDRHDFRAGDTSLEVKVSLRAAASTVTINGLAQLDPPVGGTLHLLRLVLEPVKDGTLAVSGLARNALSKASDPEALRQLIAAVGCPDADDERWNRERFRIESEQLFEVQPGFPRLTNSMLTRGAVPAGVHRLSYEIDLASAAPYRCEQGVFTDLADMLCSCQSG